MSIAAAKAKAVVRMTAQPSPGRVDRADHRPGRHGKHGYAVVAADSHDSGQHRAESALT
jgi:hypothetical protein